jgi:hypothetical protein
MEPRAKRAAARTVPPAPAPAAAGARTGGDDSTPPQLFTFQQGSKQVKVAVKEKEDYVQFR